MKRSIVSPINSLVKQVELKQAPMAVRKLDGLRKRKSDPKQIEHILQIEKQLTDYRFACYSLYEDDSKKAIESLIKALSFGIKQTSKKWERRWINKRLGQSDFESMFYYTLWKLCDSYEWYSEFYFYETLLLALDRKRINITRELIQGQGKFDAHVLPLLEETSDFIADKRIDIEKDVIDRDFIQCILREQSLTEKEKTLLYAVYNNPKLSYRELAKETGLKHHTEVTRSLKKIKSKINYIFF